MDAFKPSLLNSHFRSQPNCIISALLCCTFLTITGPLQPHKLKIHRQSLSPINILSPAMILAPPGQSDDAAPLLSPRCITVATSFNLSMLAGAECHRPTITLSRNTVHECSCPLHRWLGQDRSQEPWSTPGLYWNLQEPGLVVRSSNVVLAVEKVKLRACL
jgi:hypothetical protein